MIKNTKKGDGGNYNCIFPRLQSGEQRFNIQLDVVDCSCKDCSGETTAAPPKVSAGIRNTTEGGVRLKCDVAGASSQPSVEWQDSDGNILPAEEPQVSRRGGRYDVSLQITVKKTKTNRFLCAAKQENSSPVTDEIVVPDKLFEFHPPYDVRGMLGGLVFSGVLNIAFSALVAFLLYIRRLKGSKRNPNCLSDGSELPLQAKEDPPC